MGSLSLDDSVMINPNVLFREVDGEGVLYSLDAGIYHALDEVGTKIWQMIAANGSLRHAYESLLRQYDVDALTLERDLLGLVDRLCAGGLVVQERHSG
jgi:hypothetical protein